MSNKPNFSETIRPDPVRQVLSRNICTFSLIVINLLVFIVMVLTGDPSDGEYMLMHGANFYPLTLDGEPWRLFTSMFMHFSITHVLNNMLSLFAIGSVIEQAFGRFRFLVIYLAAGLGASLTSAVYHQAVLEPVVSAGASGAIFALSGALVCLALFRQTERYGIDSRRVPVSILISVILSSTGSTDIPCHIGGLILGFLISVFMVFVWKKKLESNGQ